MMSRAQSALRLVLAFTVFVRAPSLFADDLILTLPGEAVSAAMAEATTASVSGAPSMFGNPAGLARSDVGSISVMHTAYLESINFTTLALALPFGYRNAGGFSLSYLSFGSVPSFDSTGTEMPAYSPKDICARFGIGKSFFRTSIGASLFYLQSKIVESVTAFGGSLGITQVWGPVSWAAALENFGSAMSYTTESHPLPTQTRLGVSMQVMPAWMFNIDAVKPKVGSMWFGAGNEFRLDMNDTVNMSVRGGYDTRDHDGIPGLSGISAGAGFGWKDSALNYAWVPFGDLGQTHRLSLQISFGEDSGSRVSEREHRNRSLVARNPQQTRASVARNKTVKAALHMPFMPWKRPMPGWRTAKEKMMTLLAQDALCSSTGARAVITRTRGTVLIKTPEKESRWPRLAAGQYLFLNDTVRTYANSSADLVFANGTKAQVGANTEFAVQTPQEICDKSVTLLAKGDVYVAADAGRQLRVQTPLGEAIVDNAEARVRFDGKTVQMRVNRGEGTFVTDGISTPVEESTTFEKSEGKAVKTNSNGKPEPLVVIADATRRSMPGRWDPTYTKKFQAEIMRLDSMPGLELGEYVRDVRLRDELKLKVYDMLNKQTDLIGQQRELAEDVQQFGELKKALSVVAEGENVKTARERLKNLKQASRVLSKAQKELADRSGELAALLKETRSSQEYLAAMPIVRMLNITAQESTIPFEQGRAVVPDESKEVLDSIAAAMTSLQPFRVVIEGHTDQSGSARSNARLSKQRAESVASYLRMKTKMPPRLFITKGRGASQPLESGDTPDSMNKNRRVEIWFELRGL